MSLTKLLLEQTKLHEFSPIYKKIKNKKGFERLLQATSFKELEKIGRSEFTYVDRGSARMVFKIEDICALKVAKDNKGIGQNEVECDIGTKDWYEIVAKVFACTDNYRVVLMEYGERISDMEDVIPYYDDITYEDFNNLSKYVRAIYSADYNVEAGVFNKSQMDDVEKILKKYRKKVSDNFPEDHPLLDIISMSSDYNMNPNDFFRSDQWAIVNRNGKDIPVIVDFGLTHDVWMGHYK